jgi:hypothetical protein
MEPPLAAPSYAYILLSEDVQCCFTIYFQFANRRVEQRRRETGGCIEWYLDTTYITGSEFKTIFDDGKSAGA